MLIRRNSAEVWRVARIKKRGDDLFLEKIDTLKVSYVTTSLKIHAVQNYHNKQVHQKQITRNAPGYIRKIDGRDPHERVPSPKRLSKPSMMSSRILTPRGASIVV